MTWYLMGWLTVLTATCSWTSLCRRRRLSKLLRKWIVSLSAAATVMMTMVTATLLMAMTLRRPWLRLTVIV